MEGAKGKGRDFGFVNSSTKLDRNDLAAVSADAAQVAERLESLNPIRAIDAMARTYDSELLTDALALKAAGGIFSQGRMNMAFGVYRERRDIAFHDLLHRNANALRGDSPDCFCHGKPSSCCCDYTFGNNYLTNAGLREWFSSLQAAFPGDRIRIRTEGVGTGFDEIGCYLYLKKIFKRAPIEFVMADMVSALHYIGDASGATAVFSDEYGMGAVDNLLEISERRTPVDLEDDPRTQAFRDAFARLTETGTLPDGYSHLAITTLAPGTERLIAKHSANLAFEHHNIFDPLPAEKHAHMTILSNVLQRSAEVYYEGYGIYTDAEIISALKSIGANTLDGGIIVFMNESKGSRIAYRDMGEYMDEVTVDADVKTHAEFRRHGNRLTLEYTNHRVWKKIREIELDRLQSTAIAVQSNTADTNALGPETPVGYGIAASSEGAQEISTDICDADAPTPLQGLDAGMGGFIGGHGAMGGVRIGL